MWYLIIVVTLGIGQGESMLAHKMYLTEQACQIEGDKMREETRAKFPEARVAGFCISKEDLENSS